MTYSVRKTIFSALTGAGLAAATLIISTGVSQAAGGMNALSALANETNNTQIEQVGFFKKGGRFTNRGVATIGVGAAVVGGVVGHKVAKRNRHHQQRQNYVSHRNAHVDWCLNRFRTYDIPSNTYVSYGGGRRYCNSPYN